MTKTKTPLETGWMQEEYSGIPGMDPTQYFLDSAGIILVVVDPRGDVVHINNRGCDLLGYEKSKVIGRNWTDTFVPQMYRSKIKSSLEILVAGKIELSETGEMVVLTRSGEHRNVAYNRSAIKDRSGNISHIVFYGKDITRKKRTEEELFLSSKTLEIANQHTTIYPLLQKFMELVKAFTGCEAVGIRLLDKEGNIPYAVHAGFSREFFEMECSLTNKSDSCMCINVVRGQADPVHPFYTDGGSFYTNAATRFFATFSEDEDGELRNECNRHDFESVALVPLSSRDHVLGLIHIADTHEGMVPLEKVQMLENAAVQIGIAIQRAQAKEMLKQERDILQDVMNGTRNQHLVYLDRNFNFVRVNRAYADTCGYSPEEMIGKNHFELYPDEENEAIFAHVRDTGEPFEIQDKPFEFPDQPERGTTYWDWALSPVKDSNQQVVGLVFSLNETTERKRAETMLMNAKMEADFYLDLMSHDLTNFNQNLMGNLVLFQRQEKISDKGRPFLKNCERQVAKAENLISKVRAFSSVKEVRDQVLQPVDIDTVITDAIETLQVIYPKKNICISLPPREERRVLATDLIEHVFMNVIENAVKYTPDKNVEIDISIKDNTIDSREFWEIRIADKGPGVPDSQKAEIFDRFSRIETSKKGTGLGLSLVKAIITSFGGRIRVEDRIKGIPDKGSAFIIDMPRG